MPLLNHQARCPPMNKSYSVVPIKNMWRSDFPKPLEYFKWFVEVDGWKCDFSCVLQETFKSKDVLLQTLQELYSRIIGCDEFIARIRDFKGYVRLSYSATVTEKTALYEKTQRVNLWEYLPSLKVVFREKFHVNCFCLNIYMWVMSL
jgi:hypothetical protein